MDLEKLDIPTHDERSRGESKGEYSLVTFGGGRVVCYRKGMILMDFYRTTSVLVKDIPVPGKAEPENVRQAADAGRTDGSIPSTGATPQNMKGGQV
jgi:hypothetical protein